MNLMRMKLKQMLAGSAQQATGNEDLYARERFNYSTAKPQGGKR